MAKLRFKRLGLFYLIALGCIALSIVVSQILIQTSINRQQDDAHVINVAGRQRMLSQKISKLALKIEHQKGERLQNIIALREALALWKQSHEGLQFGDAELGLSGANSSIIMEMFETISPHYEAIYQNAQDLLSLPPDHDDSTALL